MSSVRGCGHLPAARRSNGSPQAQNRRLTTDSMRPSVMLVEDDSDLRNVYRATLAFAGFSVRAYANGLDALRGLDLSIPDVVVLDLMMPGVNGFEVRAELRARAQTRRIPVVIVTGLPAEGLGELNVECILTKPFAPDDLVAAVRRCLWTS